MAAADNNSVQTVVILKGNRLYAESLRRRTVAAFPAAAIILASSVEAASDRVFSGDCDLLITGLGSLAPTDVLEFLGTVRSRAPGVRIVVVATHWDHRVLAELRTLAVHGAFDAADEAPGNFVRALQTVSANRRYWSPSVIERMNRSFAAPKCLMRLLTTVEQMVLSVIGDGSDDAAAANELGLSPSTISSVRRDLHRKLGVQHRGELVRVAALNGFVRFTPAGVVRPGFGLLVAAHRARRLRQRVA